MNRGTVALAPALCSSVALAQDRRPGKKAEEKETAKSLAIAEQGLRFEIPQDYELRTRGFKFNWSGVRCEFQSADGEVNGTLCLDVGAGTAVQNADERVATWKERKGIKDVVVVKDDVPKRAGSWLERTITLTNGNEKRHCFHLFGVRGSRCVELALWMKDAQWEARQKEVRALADAVVFERVFLCVACGKDAGPDATECPGCKASMAAPDPELEKLARRLRIQIVTDPAKMYPFKSGGERIVAKSAPPEAVKDYVKNLLLKELKRYPEDLFPRLGVERIVLCKDLFGGSSRRGALVDYDTDSVHCDVLEGKTQEGLGAMNGDVA